MVQGESLDPAPRRGRVDVSRQVCVCVSVCVFLRVCVAGERCCSEMAQHGTKGKRVAGDAREGLNECPALTSNFTDSTTRCLT